MAQTCDADENVAFIEKRAGRMEICMKKILHLIFGRFFVVAMAIILQVLWLCVVLWQLSYKFTYVNLLVRVIAIIVVLVIVNKWTNPANKLSWTFLILLSPIFGLMVYFLFGRSGLTKHTRERMDAVNRQVEALFQRDSAVEKGLEKESRSAYLQSSYIDKWAGFPLYQNTQTKYYSCGEEMFPDMLEALRGAKHFIFLEYFIIEEGYMFNTILDILEEKAKAGVDVRFIYDDVGSINSISFGYYKKLQERGIPCVTFNPFKPLISVVMNNRDHRKILWWMGILDLQAVSILPMNISIKSKGLDTGKIPECGLRERQSGALRQCFWKCGIISTVPRKITADSCRLFTGRKNLPPMALYSRMVTVRSIMKTSEKIFI